MKITTISKTQAQKLWLQAQRLHARTPFGLGAQATLKAIEHLGYVQIDTISVVERCHHHILFTRVPDYKRSYLHQLQSIDKSVFEYWTHALAYVPTKDFRFYLAAMKTRQTDPGTWFSNVKKEEMKKVLRLIKKNGPISIRDINDDVLVEKDHAWASRKPSKRALQLGFHIGQLTISERIGMLKKYELRDRHFAWETKPKPANEKQVLNYYLDRALRAQSFVSLDSICHLQPNKKPGVKKIIEQRVKNQTLFPLQIQGSEKISYWIQPQDLDLLSSKNQQQESLVHILSPFDPLIILRKRLLAIFDYEHIFEAYIPKSKRIYGYFALPVLVDNKIVAALDLKVDRVQGKLLMQKWNWIGKNKSSLNKRKIEEELHRFTQFQLQNN